MATSIIKIVMSVLTLLVLNVSLADDKDNYSELFCVNAKNINDWKWAHWGDGTKWLKDEGIGTSGLKRDNKPSVWLRTRIDGNHNLGLLLIARSNWFFPEKKTPPETAQAFCEKLVKICTDEYNGKEGTGDYRYVGAPYSARFPWGWYGISVHKSGAPDIYTCPKWN